MNKATNSTEEFITVIPYSDSTSLPEQRIRIHKLCFWHENQYAHAVNNSNIHAFLKKAKLFGATIFPDQPNSGCFVWESELRTESGELPVFQIIYNEEIVYSMNEARSKCIIEASNYRIK
ncbi:hypothetical protein [Pseudoflavitalea rhizosphaerae]|uniref:hypothetical protein n=1 Tax=Pseudoflavitalea rhizosphaerae TaxID=1884793 RepID=UPI000F8E6353|nr:hypothetical protein [Pseudoflavitalea rhizosphaerae]